MSKKVLSVFSLVMINVIAVDSLRTLPLTAKLGLSLVFYYGVAAIGFFLPVALVAAELATSYPKTGGIYVWVREAFGLKFGFLTIWLQWIYNIVWYPTILAFIASTLAYLFAPELSNHTWYVWITVVLLFWFFTILNCYGMRVSSLVSTLGAILGTLLPMAGIILLGFIWFFQGKPIDVGGVIGSSWIPDFRVLGNLSMFPIVLFGLLGMEMSAVHAEEVRNPQRDYPRALLYSGILIFSTLLLGALAIVIVVPDADLNVVSGLVDAYKAFLDAYNLSYLLPMVVICIILGGISGVSAWIIGPTKGLLAASLDGCISKRFAYQNKHNSPIVILITQGIIFTILSALFVLLPSVTEAYWLLSTLCAQMALIAYVLMFAAAIKLRYQKNREFGAYIIPGGNIAMWVISSLGIICCLFAIFIGFIPPTQISITNTLFYELFLIIGLVLFMILPFCRKYKL